MGAGTAARGGLCYYGAAFCTRWAAPGIFYPGGPYWGPTIYREGQWRNDENRLAYRMVIIIGL